MKFSRRHVSALGCLVLGLGLATTGCGGSAEPESTAQESVPQQADRAESKARIASTTLKLENLFSDQFGRGTIDRAALQPAIDDVVQAFPEAGRQKVQEHIDEVIARGRDAVKQLTPEQRQAIAAAPGHDKVGHLEQYLADGYGWGGYAGWGGCGAFGFPGMYYYGYGYPYAYGYGGKGYGDGYGNGYGKGGYAYPYGNAYGYGYGYPYGYSSSTAIASSTGYAAAYGCGYGYGCYGLGGWGWY